MYQFMHDNSNADKTNKGAQIVFLRLAMVVWNLNVFFFLLKHKQILSDLSFRIVHESQQIWKLYIFKYCVFESVHSVSNHKRFKSGIYCPITLISVFRLQRYLKSLWDENIANQSQNKLCWLLTKGNAMYRNFSWSAGSVIKFFKNHDLQ